MLCNFTMSTCNETYWNCCSFFINPSLSVVKLYLLESWRINSPCSVKLNNGGSSLPYGSRVFVSRSSSKKVWAHAWSGEIRDEGVYSSSRDTRSIASGGVRARNTCHQHRKIYIQIAQHIKIQTVYFVEYCKHKCFLLHEQKEAHHYFIFHHFTLITFRTCNHNRMFRIKVNKLTLPTGSWHAVWCSESQTSTKAVFLNCLAAAWYWATRGLRKLQHATRFH